MRRKLLFLGGSLLLLLVATAFTWTSFKAPHAKADPPSFLIRNVGHNNMCLNVGQDRVQVYLFPCTSTASANNPDPNQVWQPQALPDRAGVKFLNPNSGLCLSYDQNTNPQTGSLQGNSLIMASCDSGSSVVWQQNYTALGLGDRSYDVFLADANQSLLMDAGANMDSGATPYLWNYDSDTPQQDTNANQAWSLDIIR